MIDFQALALPEFGGPTPLHEACLLAYPVVLEALLRAGAYATLVTRGPTGQFEESQPLAILWGDSWRHFAEQTGRSEEEHLRCMYECVQLLLRAGHPLEMLHMGMESISVEDVLDPIAFGATQYTGDASYPFDAIDLARAVRAAQLTSTSTRLTLIRSNSAVAQIFISSQNSGTFPASRRICTRPWSN